MGIRGAFGKQRDCSARRRYRAGTGRLGSVPKEGLENVGHVPSEGRRGSGAGGVMDERKRRKGRIEQGFETVVVGCQVVCGSER